MLVSRVLCRVSRNVSRSSSLHSARETPQNLHALSDQFHYSRLHPSPNTLIPVQVQNNPLWWLPIKASSTLRCGFSSSASRETNEEQQGNTTSGRAKTSNDTNTSDQADNSEAATQTKESSGSQSDASVKRTAFSGSKSKSDLSREDLIKLLAEKEKLLKLKNREVKRMRMEVLRTYAKMKKAKDRARREAKDSEQDNWPPFYLFLTC